MSTVLVDTLVHIFNIPQERTTGLSSKYTDEEHLGTNNKIEGWKWDNRYWPTTGEFDGTAYAPSLWDPETSGVEEALYQSGYGDGDDLVLIDVLLTEASGTHYWAPKINHGYFYVYDEEWYLYCDSYQTQYFAKSMAVSSEQYVELDYNFKPTIPIQARRYEFNQVLGRHIINMEFRKVVEFSDDTSEPELMIETTSSGYPTAWLNDDWSETIGSPITLVSGFDTTSGVDELELVGISDGEANQEFYTNLSPIDPYEDIEVWSFFNATAPTQWEVLSGVEPFVSSGLQVKVDRDLGRISFGDWDSDAETGAGKVPSIGEYISVHYTAGIALHYEPDFSNNYILAKGADVNPIVSSTYRGFVQALTKPSDPASITLEAELPTNSPTYLIDLGNNVGRVIATVKDATGQALEGEEVIFEILSPEIGSFGSDNTSISAITDSDGQGKAVYSAPPTIDDVGQATADISWDGSNTIIEVEDVRDPGTVSGLYLYKVHEYDLALGIPSSGVEGYYTDYLDEENIESGVTATEDWEEEYRTLHDLEKPVTYETTALDTGKKTCILTQNRSNIVDPHTGEYTTSGYAPLYASLIEDISTTSQQKLSLTFSGNLPLPGTDDTKAYFVVGDALASVRAYVINRRTNTRLYSDPISVMISIPEAISGTYFASVLSSVPSGLLTRFTDIDTVGDSTINATSGIDEYENTTFHDSYLEERLQSEDYVDWFRRTRRADSRGLYLAGLGLESVEIASGIEDLSGEIPLGFRLSSTGITVASMLDQVTYLDHNQYLPSGYYDV